MEVFLGIDGGGTKTKFILCSRDGHIIAETVKPACSYLQVGFPRLTEILSEGLSDVCAMAGVASGDIVHAFAGTSCYGDVEADCSPIRAAVAAAMGSIPHTIGNDCENSLAGTLGGDCGISIICGTGSIACGMNAKGEVMRCGGWHQAIGGDEGSGYWLGLQLIRLFTRQSDGRDPVSPLYAAVKNALGISSDDAVVSLVVNEWGMDRTKIAALSGLISGLHAQGDPYVKDLLRQAACELASLAGALYRRLSFSGIVPVSYSGGVFNLGELILSPLRDLLSEGGMKLRPPKQPPDIGALILAFMHAGVPVPESLAKA